MTTKISVETWHQVEGLFEQAVKLPRRRRRELLEKAAVDTKVRAEVGAMLEADASTGNFLDRPTDVAWEERQDGSELLAPGGRLGPYRLLHELGFGGMSRVFEAEGGDGYRRRVAIKVVEARLDSAGAARRFRTERQILAALDHPSIARLYDGGETAQGKPYFVLELVDGLPIDAYCRSRKLSLRRRVELMIEVCDAVTYAHQHLIVHRDLKPANILVTVSGDESSGERRPMDPQEASGSGRVKLLDFGIAKVLEPSEFPLTVDITRTGQQPMTLQYASPEQVRCRPVTTATDVYALGLVLYQLLAGTRPYEVVGLPLGKVEEMICVREPAAPSERVGEEPEAASPGLRAAHLRGDLDNIVLRALAKEPGRRYGSARELADDLRRFLDGKAVAARAPTWAYRAGKFARRHAAWIGALGLFVVVSSSLSAALWVQSADLERQRDSAYAAWQTAVQAKREAQEVSTFLVDTFAHADPALTRGKTVTAAEILAAGVEQIDSDELDLEPAVRSKLRSSMAQAYYSLGSVDEALPLFEKSLQDAEKAFGETHLETAAIQCRLARIHLGRDDFDGAEQALEYCLPIRLEALGEDHVLTAEARFLQGQMYFFNARYGKARRELGPAAEVLSRVHGPVHKATLEARAYFAYAHREPHLLRRSTELFERQAEDTFAAFGEDHPESASAYMQLAHAALMEGDVDAGRQAGEKALAIRQTIFGEDHPETARAAYTVAVSTMHRDPVRARELLTYVLAVDKRVWGPDTWYAAIDLASLGVVEHIDGYLEAAESYLRRSMEIVEQAIPKKHMAHWYPAAELSRLLIAQDRGAEAVPLMREVYRARSESPSAGIGGPLEARALLGLALLGSGEEDEGREHLRAVVEALDRGEILRVSPWARSLEKEVRAAVG